MKTRGGEGDCGEVALVQSLSPSSHGWTCHICGQSFTPAAVHYNARYNYWFAHCPCGAKVDEKE